MTTTKLGEVWRWYVDGTRQDPNSSSTFRVLFRVFKFFALWCFFFFVLYRLIPHQYWPFFKGILANPFVLFFFPCLYVRGIVLDFLNSRLKTSAAGPKIDGVFNDLNILEEYRQSFGRSDFFYKLYVSIGWVALGSLMVGGLYWFFSLP
jgi:hypothetical protein